MKARNYTVDEMCFSVVVDIRSLEGNIKITTVKNFYGGVGRRPPTARLIGAGTGFTGGISLGATVRRAGGPVLEIVGDFAGAVAGAANQQEAGQSGASNVGNSSIPLDTLEILNSTRVIPVNPTNST
ncbi:hypothetical protein C1646_750724 [Rhizophagus diaphanus]|nr:hypothetical protein C1646_750724 [Rhizophagus diaphanus] [Rhizophagus sp. MUCL 43196]